MVQGPLFWNRIVLAMFGCNVKETGWTVMGPVTGMVTFPQVIPIHLLEFACFRTARMAGAMMVAHPILQHLSLEPPS